MKHLKILLLLLLFGSSALVATIPSLRAVPPATNLTISPSHATEGSTVSVSLSLTGYTSGQKFNFTLKVTDPFPHSSTAWKIASVGAGGSATLSFSYATDFSGIPAPTTNLNGTYTVQIIFSNETPATYPTNPFFFSAGPTDHIVYQRTQTVSILATGYKVSEQTTVNITKGGVPVLNFPQLKVPISSTGVVTYSWQVPLSAVGRYLVQVLGNSTKPIADSENITVIPAVLLFKNQGASTASGVSKTSFLRGEKVYGVFNVTYPDGTQLKTATGGSINIFNPSKTLVATLPASYNSTENQYLSTTSFFLNESAPLGTWIIGISANTTSDGLSPPDLGPLKDLNTTFTLSPLTLQTSITALKNTYNRTVTFNVNATVSYPTTLPFNSSSGAVSANLTSGTRMIPVSLAYNSATHKWIGSITIPPDYPLGSAILQVSAHDKYGNTGSDTSLRITVTPTAIIVRQVPFDINGTGTFQPFQTFAIQINATYINNQTLLQGPGGFGSVIFSLPGGRSISVALTLESNHTLTGQYMIRENDPLGTWNLTLTAGRLNDGYGNTNTKNILGPIVKVLSLPLTFDSSLIPSPIVTGDKASIGVAFRYPNGSLAQNLYVNGTVSLNGQNTTYTFTFDTGTRKYLARIDTTGWAPGQHQLNIYAYSADYRGYQPLGLTLQAAPFPVGQIIGAVLIVIVLGLGFVEYTRRRVQPE